MTNEKAQVVAKFSYDVFGNVIKDVIKKDGMYKIKNHIEARERFLFTGREFVKEIGIYDYRNRLYSASLGKFLQRDPILFAGGDVNLMRYVKNDPINLSDPYGLGFMDWIRNLFGARGSRPGPGPGEVRDAGMAIGGAMITMPCIRARTAYMNCLNDPPPSDCDCSKAAERKRRICDTAQRGTGAAAGSY